MAMKCPKCGAENADHIFYCGSCGSALRDAPTKNSGASQQVVSPEGGVDSAAAHKAKVQQSMRQVALIFGALSALWLFLNADSILGGGWDYIDFIQVCLAGLFAVVAVFSYWASTNDETVAYIRIGGWVGNVSAEVSGFSLNQMILVLSAIIIGGILGLAQVSTSEIFLVSAIIFAMAGLVIPAMLYKSKVTLEDTGICIGHAYRIRQFIPFDRVSSVVLIKNVLTVSLNKRPPLNFRTHRFLLLGNIQTMRNELDRVAPSGTPTRVRDSPQQKQPGPMKSGIVFVGTGKSNLTPAGIMLIIAGLFAILTAAVLFIWDSSTSTPGSSPLFCCGSLEIIFGAIIILGGLQTIRRVKYRLSMTAAVVAIISGGLGFSLILGIIALVMIHRSREDFRD
ncbi:MAG: zinc ribbon domain-containing protein [Candidatus Thermoplasmatota archaeon]|nr:zinc ribbon domain-containing protein [Candidatus Thermoplasmatota archaeon]